MVIKKVVKCLVDFFKNYIQIYTFKMCRSCFKCVYVCYTALSLLFDYKNLQFNILKTLC